MPAAGDKTKISFAKGALHKGDYARRRRIKTNRPKPKAGGKAAGDWR